jgi:tRNA pseudouridine38-40 synthase
MPRLFLELSYHGGSFFGWQIQPDQISVQETIERALTRLNSNEPIKVVGCGRTDTGVHAKQYALHFDIDIVPDELVYKLNKMLPSSIAISDAYEVPEDKHARFDATSRTYRYFINQTKDPFKDGLSWYQPLSLDVNKMNEAAQHLLGKKDFSSFAKIHTDVKTHICDLRVAKWFSEGDQLVFEITADRFLRNMVRAVVGTLVEVGLGKITPADIPVILAEKDRAAAATSAPAEGLFLWEVKY